MLERALGKAVFNSPCSRLVLLNSESLRYKSFDTCVIQELGTAAVRSGKAISVSDRRLRMKLRIVVADDNPKMLSAMVGVLSQEFDVAATANDGRAALEQIQRLAPAVAVLDLNMPGLNGIQITRELVRQHLEVKVVICSVENDPELIEAARMAGALGYVLKPRINRDLVAAVRCAASGTPFFPGS